MKKVRCEPPGNRHGIIPCKNEEREVSDSLTSDTAAVQYNTELSAQLASILNISMNDASTSKSIYYNGAAACRNRKEIMSNCSEAGRSVLQDSVASANLKNILKVSLNQKSEKDSTAHNSAAVCKNKEKVSLNNSELSTKLAAMLKISPNYKLELKNDVLYKNRTKNILHETSKTSSNYKLKHDGKAIKDEVAECLSSCTQQEESSTSNQININNKLMKKHRKSKTKECTVTDISQSNTRNVRKEHCKNDKKKLIGNTMYDRPQTKFLDHVGIDEIKKMLKKQKSNNIKYVEGRLRINYRSYKYAYLTMKNGECDLLINGAYNRNRAFDGDLVVAHINPEKDWRTLSNGQIQKTGTIISILEKIHPRKAVGYLKQENSFVLFQPRDHRIPFVRIKSKSLPSLYHSDPSSFINMMVFIKIDSWKNPKYALGQVIRVLGKTGEIDAELTAILLENDLDVSPYQEKLLKGLPKNDNILTDTDIKDREDLRHECIFTIDPDDAIDLDDAISCKILDNGNYEIGVHVSDVTHYLEFLSPLDIEVSKRATTVYLANAVYHMLPKELCHVCSLLSGADRLAFSVIWEITPDAQIVKHRFSKTVIRSCCQISYNTAQAIIENPDKTWPENFLNIKGNHVISLLCSMVNNLFKLSIQLRNKRFADGALKLDRPKLHMRLDSTIHKNGIAVPVDYYLEEIKDSNRLIEEFMLLANMTVATQLYKAIPKTALLRIHNDPSKYVLTTTCDMLRNYGIHLDIETAGSLHASIQNYENNSECNSNTVHNPMKYIMLVIVNLCSKAMARAEYKCASTSSLRALKHYALNAPLYTHFTSPIRRYSDCIVHRLLQATIENKPLPIQWTTKLCSSIATTCNTKKYSAKLAQEQSTELFFLYMISLAGTFQSLAIVFDVKEHNIDVILHDSGIRLRIYIDDMRDDFNEVLYRIDCSIPTIYISWKKTGITQVINIFSMVDVQVEKHSELYRLKAILLPSVN